jgi:hypothetical protein
MLQNDTPPDHTVMGLRVDVALLPEWFDAIKDLVGQHGRRMMVIEKPDEWVVQIEIHNEKKPVFSDALTTAWADFVAQRKAEGRWEE